MQWPNDVTQHRAAYYWLAECGSAEKVATMLGRSIDQFHLHYKALVTKKEAERFWVMTPSR